MSKELLQGSETKAMIKFAVPMIIGNLFQQMYNVADTIIVGRFIGYGALAAVGSSFAIMVFLTSIILGLCMGSSAVFSFYFGAGDIDSMKSSFFASLCFIGIVTIIINILALTFIDEILAFMRTPDEILTETKTYLQIVFYGIGFTSVYNYFSAIMRSMGNSVVPLVFLILAAVINIVLDIIFIVPYGMGVGGAAYATVIAQGLSAISIGVYCILKVPEVRIKKRHLKFTKKIGMMISNYSLLTSIQQSVMNFGILMIQGLVNSFGVSVMAAFAAVVKIDSFAYMPVQDFGNAFSTFIAQNKGAENYERIKKGIFSAVKIITCYCVAVTIIVVVFSKPLMMIFVDSSQVEVIEIGVKYLYIEGSFYCLIGYLFMFYGLFRGVGNPKMSIILTVFSLGTRVSLAYIFAPTFGVTAIWWAIPIGWALADMVGIYAALPLIKGVGKKGEVL